MPFQQYAPFFQPEELDTLTAAFNATWQELRASGIDLSTEDKIALVKRQLAQCILVSATARVTRFQGAKSMSKQKPTAEEVATFIMAKGNADRVQSYVSRGRRFRDLNDTKLCEKYVEGIREWASDPTDPVRRLLSNDVNAEYDLRGVQPPDGVATAELDAITAATARAIEEMPEDRQEEINTDMYTEYLSGKKQQH